LVTVLQFAIVGPTWQPRETSSSFDEIRLGISTNREPLGDEPPRPRCIAGRRILLVWRAREQAVRDEDHHSSGTTSPRSVTPAYRPDCRGRTRAFVDGARGARIGGSCDRPASRYIASRDVSGDHDIAMRSFCSTPVVEWTMPDDPLSINLMTQLRRAGRSLGDTAFHTTDCGLVWVA
jgi:hypothetical protein